MSITMEKLVNDLQTLRQRKEETMMNFHQIMGAISILEQMIAEYVKNQKPDDTEVEDGSTDNEETEQAS